MPKPNFKVMLADDHIVLRDALGSLINTFDHFKVCSVAADGEEVMKVMKSGSKPDILLLDLNMPKMDGYETARWMHQNYPDVSILTLTMYDSEIALIRLLQMGVRGFLKKDIHPKELNDALNSVMEHGYYYSHSATGKLASFFHKNHTAQSSIERALLSEKEIDFLRLASTDLTYKEIAVHFGITARAVDGFRDILFDKLDVKSRVGLAIYAVKNGIVTF